jgi:hypothetical protein
VAEGNDGRTLGREGTVVVPPDGRVVGEPVAGAEGRVGRTMRGSGVSRPGVAEG